MRTARIAANPGRNCRPAVAGVVREFRRFCEEQKIPISRIVHETGYQRVAKVFSGEATTLRETTLETLKGWMREEKQRINYQGPVMSLVPPAPAEDTVEEDKGQLTLDTPMATHDIELDMIHCLAQVVENFYPITSREERQRALNYITARFGSPTI
ncbi:hypothetical protein [Kineobactrum salinum]|uniref:Uncharacterized protein n=1 Tax=Kineobactrum salinum TaxID=2708301 RepID=A0A6C0UB11_9GAMM|nr:hypothetical protein [Kineobactrum salinum]QIB67134.1 hypothetical protein G3T16_18750 [Kineobactrum salinum]